MKVLFLSHLSVAVLMTLRSCVAMVPASEPEPELLLDSNIWSVATTGDTASVSYMCSVRMCNNWRVAA